MEPMNRRSLLGLLATGFVAFLVAPVASVGAVAAPQIRAGDACKKLGRRQTAGSKTFECTNVGGVRQWKRVKPSATTPTAPSTSEIKLLDSAALALGQSLTVVAAASSQNYAVVVTRTSNGIVAFSRVCTHRGTLVAPTGNNQLTCPSHGAVFNASTGAVIEGPAERALTSYKASERNGSIYITV